MENINIDSLEKAYRQPGLLEYSCSTDLVVTGKELLDSGVILFTISCGIYIPGPRYDEELRQVCKEFGFRTELEPMSPDDVGRRCLYGYMDLVLAKKYGPDIKRRIHEKADSLFEAKAGDKYNTYWDCTTWPKLPDEEKRESYKFTVDTEDTAFAIDSDWNNWPKVSLGIFLNANGEIDKIVLEEYNPGLPQNTSFKDQAFELAKKDFMSNYAQWDPCLIGSRSVKSFIVADYYLKRK